MARKRKRPDYGQTVFKFGAMPAEKLPQDFWDRAKSMMWLWNELVTRRETLWEKIKHLDKKDRLPFYEQFEIELAEFYQSSEVRSRLRNDEYAFVFDAFKTADLKAKKEKASLRKKFYLNRIIFPRRYGGGGIEFSALKKRRSKIFDFLFPSELYYQDDNMDSRRGRRSFGRFGMQIDPKEKENFRFSAIIHREIPENAIIKSIAWTGVLKRGSGYKKTNLPESERDWKWSIVVTVEIPKPEPVQNSYGRLASLDVGWRVLNNDFLRIGTLKDTDGNQIEIRSPINYASCRVEYGRLKSGLKELIALDEQIGNLVEFTKYRLRHKVSIHPKTREGGLFKLRKELELAGDKPDVVKRLKEFEDEYLPLRSIRARSETRLQNYRDWVYQNIADWIAENYDALIWEGKLSLKNMAEDRKNINNLSEEEAEAEKIRRLAAKYRQFASIYKFRDYIKKAFEKRGKKIIDGQTAYTSRKCSECGEIVEKFSNVEFVCPNGHNFDRDFNANTNLLNQVTNFMAVKGQPLTIPDDPTQNLSEILVKVPVAQKAAGTTPKLAVSVEKIAA